MQEKSFLLLHASDGEVEVQQDGSLAGRRVLHLSRSEAPGDLDIVVVRLKGTRVPHLIMGLSRLLVLALILTRIVGALGVVATPQWLGLERQIGSFGSSRAHERVPSSCAREPARVEC